MDAKELKPCPFCGGPVKLEQAASSRGTIFGERKWWGVVCRNTINRGGTCAIQQTPSASEDAAIDRWNMRTPAAAAGAPDLRSEPTDISAQLREYAGNPGYSHNDYADVMRQAADECERFYGGMLAWKKTAEKKDADWNAERMDRVNERRATRATLASAAPVEAHPLTPFEIVGIAKAEGLKVRTGQGAIRFARAIEARIMGGAK